MDATVCNPQVNSFPTQAHKVFFYLRQASLTQVLQAMWSLRWLVASLLKESKSLRAIPTLTQHSDILSYIPSGNTYLAGGFKPL